MDQTNDVNRIEWAVHACVETGDLEQAGTILREALAARVCSVSDVARIREEVAEMHQQNIPL